MEVNRQLRTLRALPQGNDTTIQLNSSLCEHTCKNYKKTLYNLNFCLTNAVGNNLWNVQSS